MVTAPCQPAASMRYKLPEVTVARFDRQHKMFVAPVPLKRSVTQQATHIHGQKELLVPHCQ